MKNMTKSMGLFGSVLALCFSMPAQAQTQAAPDGEAKPKVYNVPGQNPLLNQLLQQQMQKPKNKPKSQVPPIDGLSNLLKGMGSGGPSRGSGSSAGGGDRPGATNECGAAVNNCPHTKPDPTALQTMLECVGRSSVATNRYAGLVDYEKKVMFIIDRNSGGSSVLCVPVSTGKSTGDQKGQTPTGYMFTTSHQGNYQSSGQEGTQKDCIGLSGTDGETQRRCDNGVILHKAHCAAGTTSTAGCIGVEDSLFDQVKSYLYGTDSTKKTSAIFVFTPENREKCTIGKGIGRGNGGGGSGETGSGVNYPSGPGETRK